MTQRLHRYSTFSQSTIRSAQFSDRDKSSYSSRHKICCCLCRLSHLILHPVGPFRCVWDLAIMLVLIYTSIEVPYTMSFGQSPTVLFVGFAVDFILLIDILFNFNTAYFDKYDSLRLITDKKYICKRYFRTWFFIDLVTCIPYEIFSIYYANADEASNAFKILRVFRLFRIIKIIRLFKLSRIFDMFSKQFLVREAVVLIKIFKVIFAMLFCAHLAACAWWSVGYHAKSSGTWVDKQCIRDCDDIETKITLRSDDIDTFTQYSYAWYWAVVTLFTTGYGDIVATNTIEQWVCSLCILTGTCFFAYFIGTLTVLITEGDKVKAYEIEKLEEAQLFCEQKKLPKELTHAICTHIRYHCQYNYTFDESELLGLLPSYLQHDIQSYVAKQFLMDLDIFHNEYIQLPEFIIGLIAIKTKSISCNQSFNLYDVNDTAKAFYIQRTGRSIMYDSNDELVTELSRGSVCGEYSSFLFKKRKSKVECQTWSEFYSISVDDIREILDTYYPKSSIAKWKRMQSYLKHAYRRNIQHSLTLNGESDENSDIDDLNIHESTYIYSAGLTCRQYTHSNTVPRAHMDRQDTDAPRFTALTKRSHTQHLDQNDVNNIQRTITPQIGKQRTKTLRAKLNPFNVRTNSGIRDMIVAAHVQKHLRSSAYDVQTPVTEKRATISVNKEGIDPNKIDKVACAQDDSECSFSSTSNFTMSSDDERGRLMPLTQKWKSRSCTMSVRKPNKKAKRTVHRKRKVGGKFGGGKQRIKRATVGRNRNRAPRMTRERRSYDSSADVDTLDAAILLDALSVSYRKKSHDLSATDVVINIGYKSDPYLSDQNDQSDGHEHESQASICL
eukprot:275654_1